MKHLESFWNSLDGVVLARKRELALGGLLCLTAGLTLGMLLSPRKTVTIGSNNIGTLSPDALPEEEAAE